MMPFVTGGKERRFEKTIEKYDGCHVVQVDSDKSVVNFLAETFSSFHVTSSDSFREMINMAYRLIVVKDWRTYSKMFANRAEDMRKSLCENLTSTCQEVLGISMTTDLWTSRGNKRFLSLTLHAVNDQYDLIRVTPHITPFKTR